MAVLVSNGATSLSTVNGWYRAEAYNIGQGPSVTTTPGLSTGISTMAITYANAGNAQGIILGCIPGSTTSNVAARTFTAQLQEAIVVTMTIASPCVITWTGTAPADGTQFAFTTTGALPTGLSAARIYYVVNSSGATSNVALTAGGAAINTSGSQSGTHTAWTSRASKTLRFDEIYSVTDYTKYSLGGWVTPFIFPTPYAVDTTAGKWRFAYWNSDSSAMSLAQSTSGNYSYIAWCDNALTFANNDVIVCKDIVTIDQSATLGTVSPTGIATAYYSAVVCRSMSMAASACLLQWQNPPSASYTLTLKGRIALGSHSGFAIGSSASPISYANRAVLDLTTATSASDVGIGSWTSNGAANGSGKSNVYLFGAYDTSIRTTLNGAVANGASSFVTTASTGWASGDIVTVGRPAQGGSNRAYYTLTGTSGTTVNISGTIAGARSSGGQVVKLNRTCGIEVKLHAGGGGMVATGIGCSNCQVRGVEIYSASNSRTIWTENQSNRYSENNINYFWEDPANILEEHFFEYCNMYSTDASNFANAMTSIFINQKGLRIKYCNFHQVPLLGGYFARADAIGVSGYLKIQNNVGMHFNNGSTGNFAMIASPTSGQVVGQLDVQDNVMEGNQHAFFYIHGLNCIHKNNDYWGGGTQVALGDDGAVLYGQLLNPVEISGNKYNANACAICFMSQITLDSIESNSLFGNISANTKDIMQKGGGYTKFEFANAATISNIDTANLTSTLPGTHIRYTNLNGTTNNDSGYLTYGYFQRTGTGLSDTTVHTAGGYGMRFQPTSSTTNLALQFIVPTGNIYNRTMNLAVWVKLNSATYYAGTHQLPRLTVNYDNGTIAYSQAAQSTAWQLLFVSFTPTTTYGELTVTISGRTDATGSSAYIYWDDFAIQYPAGYQLDLGALDIWAHALPVLPPIATNLSALSVWTAPSTVDYGSSTMGEKVAKKLLTTNKFIGLS